MSMTKPLSNHKTVMLQKLIPLLCLLLFSSTSIIAQEPEPILPALIPVPKTMEAIGNPFTIVQGTPILLPNELEGTPIHSTLNELMYTTTWLNGNFVFYEGNKPSMMTDSAIILLLHNPENLQNDTHYKHLSHQEGYRIHVTPEQLKLEASTEHGLFNAIMTLRQLLPTEVEK